jgi:hypothetical protein
MCKQEITFLKANSITALKHHWYPRGYNICSLSYVNSRKLLVSVPDSFAQCTHKFLIFMLSADSSWQNAHRTHKSQTIWISLQIFVIILKVPKKVKIKEKIGAFFLLDSREGEGGFRPIANDSKTISVAYHEARFLVPDGGI